MHWCDKQAAVCASEESASHRLYSTQGGSNLYGFIMLLGSNSCLICRIMSMAAFGFENLQHMVALNKRCAPPACMEHTQPKHIAH
jgi:hypothetical protein